MANRMTNQFPGALEKGVVHLFLDVSFGAAGAPTIVRGKGIQSVTKTATGTYQVKLGMISTPASAVDTYQRLLAFSRSMKGQPQDTNNLAPGVYITDNSAAGNVVLNFQNASGVAADPASGDEMLVHLILSNSAAY